MAFIYVITVFFLILTNSTTHRGKLKPPEGNHLHILGRFPLDLLINGEDLLVYLGRGFCVCGLSGVIVDLQYSYFFVLFIYSLFLFLPNLGKSETSSISDCDSFSASFETRSTTDVNL